MSLRIFFLGCLLAFPVPFFYAQEQQTDRFAQIGTRVQSVRFNLLREVTPAPLPEIYLPVIHRPDAVFEPVYSMNTPEELYDELDRLRERYKPFMKNLAPSLQDERIQVPLDEFLWREETSGDLEDFKVVLNGAGEWVKVKIPHYGPPLGRAVTYYFRTFEVNDEMLEKGSLFLFSKGWTPVLTSGNPNWKGDKGQAMAVADYPYGKGLYRICQIGLQNRLKAEPVANKLIRELKTQ